MPWDLTAAWNFSTLNSDPAFPQQAPHQPTQPRYVAHVVAFDHVAQHRHVDVVPQETMPGRRVDPLHLREATGLEPVQKRTLQPRVLAARPESGGVRPPGYRPPPVTQRLLEAEWMDQNLPGTAPQRSGDLSRQQGGRRPGDEDTGAFGVEQSPDEPLPSGHDLNLVETPRDGRGAVTRPRKPAVVLADQRAEVRGVETSQALVFEG